MKVWRGIILLALGVGVCLFVLAAQNGSALPNRQMGRGGRGSRFTIYPPNAIADGAKSYNTTCGYCHGERGKGGQAGPDLIVSVVTLHDENGVQIGEYLKGDAHQKQVQLNLPADQLYNIAAYLHSRVIYAAGRGEIHEDQMLVGDAKTGEAYFNGAGKCNQCHSPTGDLKGIGSKYSLAVLQNKLVMPRSGRGGFGLTGPNPATAIKATVTLPTGQEVSGELVRLTDFDVTIRTDDGLSKSFARENGSPKVVVVDPLQGHLDLLTKLTDTDMHNLTAYLATLK